MSSLIIEGKKHLSGEIRIAGNKNAALPIIAATVLTDDECELVNVPNIRDVEVMLSLLKKLGKTVERLSEDSVRITGTITSTELDETEVKKMRASILFLGSVLARTGRVTIGPPGGCVIGRRGVDSHFDAIRSLGAQITFEDDHYQVELVDPGSEKIFLREASVTATENVMYLTAAREGQTIIENSACEPHISDLADVLRKMGAEIEGDGTNRMRVAGKKSLKGFTHKIQTDHIEAGTFVILAAATGSDIIIRDMNPEHLQMPFYFFSQMGIDYKVKDQSVLEVHPSKLHAPTVKVQTGLWPGFPTDLMSPMIVLATQSEGVTLCHDWLYESRMFFTDKLIAMGAQVTLCDPHRVLVTGPTPLRGQHLSTPDIRAGIALVIAALCAEGRSIIDKAELIDRGYENLTHRLRAIGASVEWQQGSVEFGSTL